MGLRTVFTKDLHVKVESGIVTATRVIDNCGRCPTNRSYRSATYPVARTGAQLMRRCDVIVNPWFQIDAQRYALLQQDLREEEAKIRPRSLPQGGRKRLSESVAMDAVDALLSQLEPEHRFHDANSVRMNQPGYDFLVDDRVRIQVKGCTYPGYFVSFR